jgi:hypothetical protein
LKFPEFDFEDRQYRTKFLKCHSDNLVMQVE